MRLPNEAELEFLINTDKLYKVQMRGYQRQADVVLYNFVLIDLVACRSYSNWYRYNELKNFHVALEQLEVSVLPMQMKLPEFPQSHFWTFWKRTNKDKGLIQQRRQELEFYFNVVLNDPAYRGSSIVKNFVRDLKHRSSHEKRRHSENKRSQCTNKKRLSLGFI